MCIGIQYHRPWDNTASGIYYVSIDETRVASYSQCAVDFSVFLRALTVFKIWRCVINWEKTYARSYFDYRMMTLRHQAYDIVISATVPVFTDL